MRTISVLRFALGFVLAVLIGGVAGSASASTSYREALQCHAQYAVELGEVNAAVLCRGVEYSNATAVYDCVSRTRDSMSVEARAQLCQGISYRLTTATLNCFSDAMAYVDSFAAAMLCQRTDYAAYTAKLNCLRDAVRGMSGEAAATVCGGITPNQ